MPNFNKCAIIGCGHVGASVAYTYSTAGLFEEMVLIDVNKRKAEGEAMDLLHGLPFSAPMNIYAGDYSDLADAGLIVLAAGVNQKEGETRLQLLSSNLRIFESIVRNVTRYNTDAILLVVTNPVDVLTYYTLRNSGYPAARVIGTGTVLDTARLKQLIGQRLAVDSRNVHAFIIGEHGDSELAVWSSANVSGIDLNDFCDASGCRNMSCLHGLFEEVRDSAYKIIAGKGATYYAIAQAVLRITSCILRNECSVLPVSCYVNGQYGLRDVCLGLPAIVGREGVERVLDITLSDEEAALLRQSAETVTQELRSALAAYC